MDRDALGIGYAAACDYVDGILDFAYDCYRQFSSGYVVFLSDYDINDDRREADDADVFMTCINGRLSKSVLTCRDLNDFYQDITTAQYIDQICFFRLSIMDSFVNVRLIKDMIRGLDDFLTISMRSYSIEACDHDLFGGTYAIRVFMLMDEVNDFRFFFIRRRTNAFL